MAISLFLLGLKLQGVGFAAETPERREAAMRTASSSSAGQHFPFRLHVIDVRWMQVFSQGQLLTLSRHETVASTSRGGGDQRERTAAICSIT